MSGPRLAPKPYTSPWLTDDVADMAQVARVFFEREVTPHTERFAQQHQVDTETWLAAGRAGLLCASIPTEYGGGGGTFAHEAAVLWEQARACDDALGIAVHSTIVAPYIAAYGTDEQKQRWLPRMASGELVGAIAMTEPSTGSDLQSIRTTARLDPEGDDGRGEYVIDGSKTFITNATHAGLVIVVARTGDAGAHGISLIVVETDDLAGFDRGRVLAKIGQHGQDTRELSFTQVRVPAANLLGAEGEGFVQLMNQLPQERLAIAVGAVAAAERATELALAYTKEREAFGRPIAAFQNTRFTLAEVTTDVLAARTFLDHCVALHLAGELDAATASRAKYWCTDLQCEVVDRCLQLFGGYGYMTEYPIARMYAAARVQRIYGGTNEIMKDLIARFL